MYTTCMAVLNVRNVPDVLMKRLKSDAALLGRTLRDHVVSRLGNEAVGEGVAREERAPDRGVPARTACVMEPHQIRKVAGSNPAATPKPDIAMNSDGYVVIRKEIPAGAEVDVAPLIQDYDTRGKCPHGKKIGKPCFGCKGGVAKS